MSEQPQVTRRHILLGGVAVAAMALAPSVFDDAPTAYAMSSCRRKYHYSINPASNAHRYGWLETPLFTSSSLPVAILIHGGAWESEGGPASMRFLSEFLCQHGVACWNIEYRALGTGGGWPTTYADVCDAIDHLIALKLSVAPKLDLDRVYLVGHSAGAQLAALAMGQASRQIDVMGLLMNTPLMRLTKESMQLADLRGDVSLKGGETEAVQHELVGTGNSAGRATVAPKGPRIPIRGFVSLNGVLDVVDSANRSKFSNIRVFLGGTPAEVPGNYAAANPIRHMPAEKKMLLVQGTHDYVIPHGQVKRYGLAASRRGNTVTYLTLQGAKHNDVLLPSRNPAAYQAVTKALAQFIGATSSSTTSRSLFD